MLVDKIKNIVPEAEIDESGILTVTVEPAKYRELALRLEGEALSSHLVKPMASSTSMPQLLPRSLFAIIWLASR